MTFLLVYVIGFVVWSACSALVLVYGFQKEAPELHEFQPSDIVWMSLWNGCVWPVVLVLAIEMFVVGRKK